MMFIMPESTALSATLMAIVFESPNFEDLLPVSMNGWELLDISGLILIEQFAKIPLLLAIFIILSSSASIFYFVYVSKNNIF